MNTATNLLKTASLIVLITLSTNSVFSNPSPDAEMLLSFRAKPSDETVKIAWQFSEDTEGLIHIQRAGVDMKFETIGEHPKTVIDQFVDKQPQQGLSFYRLAIPQADGTIVYYQTMAVSR